MAYLDEHQLKRLLKDRLESGEAFTPRLLQPKDIINYFIFIGNAICRHEDKSFTSIRYCIENPYPITTEAELEEIIQKHRGVFRTSLSRLKADFAKEGKTLVQFKAFFQSATLLEASNKHVLFHWQFSLKERVNKSMTLMQDIFIEEA